MKTISFVLLALIIIVSFSCKSHKLLNTVNCPGAIDDLTLYSEIFYHYKFLKEVPRDEIDQSELSRLDSLYSFTVDISGHEGWVNNLGARYNEYYHPQYFVLENPNEFEGKPREDHDFSFYCPNKLSELIRLHVQNNLQIRVDELKVSVEPYKYLYNKKTKHYQALVKIVDVDTTFFY